MQVTAHPALRPQAQAIFQALVQRGSLSSREAMDMHPPCYRLAARIGEIRLAFGADAVVTESEAHGSGTHARYRWVEPGPAQGTLGL